MIFIPSPYCVVELAKNAIDSLGVDDPYQYSEKSIDDLVKIWFIFKNQNYYAPVLEKEIRLRLENPDLSDEDREVLTKTLANR